MGRRVVVSVLTLAVAVACAAVVSASSADRVAAKQPTVARMIGQTLMGGMEGTSPDAELLARITRGQLGGVILFGGNITTRPVLTALVARLQAAAAAGGNPPLLIATDQEGGDVKRLTLGPPNASAETMGKTDTPGVVEQQGRATAAYLAKFGIDVDLAPVLDVGDSATSFLGDRIFSSIPKKAATLGSAFATGLQASGHVAATAKHFPGLGTAPVNTDDKIVIVRTSRAELTRRLASFKEAIKAGVKLVMVSNAGYPALDPSKLPAALSPRIVTTLLRGELGFTGVVITDTLSAPSIAAHPDAGVLALNAGVDVLLYSDGEPVSAKAYNELLDAARNGTLKRATIVRAYNHVMKLKRSVDSIYG